MVWSTESGTGSGLKRRIERRVRRKLCSSGVKVEVGRFDSEDDPLLVLAGFPGFVIVFEGKFIDVLICAFCCVTYNFAANTEIAITVVRILNRHRYFWTSLHVFIFHAPCIRVDENMLTLRAEPDGRDLWRTIG